MSNRFKTEYKFNQIDNCDNCDTKYVSGMYTIYNI